MNRLVAMLPESVAELCLVRLGLIATKVTAWPFLIRMIRTIQKNTRQPTAASQGLLHSDRLFVGSRHVVFLQYWSSFDQVEAWSHQPLHAGWWQAANTRMRTRRDFAVYHESYVVPRTAVESIYLNCPLVGLASFGPTVAAEGSMTTSRDRLGRRVMRSGPP